MGGFVGDGVGGIEFAFRFFFVSFIYVYFVLDILYEEKSLRLIVREVVCSVFLIYG